MHKIRLETADGSYVTTAVIPPFTSMPEVLTWWERTFTLATPVWETAKGPTYSEAFAVAVISVDDSRAEG